MTQTVATIRPTPSPARAANVLAKAALVILPGDGGGLYPDSANLRDKAAGVRAVVYPLLAFAVPPRGRLPAARLRRAGHLVAPVQGPGRLSLGGRPPGDDDLLHRHPRQPARPLRHRRLVRRLDALHEHRAPGRGPDPAHPDPDLHPRRRRSSAGLAFGATAAIGWEIGEYVAFVSRSSERRFAYADTLGDLGLGTLGAVVAAGTVHRLWARRTVGPRRAARRTRLGLPHPA